MSCNVPNGTIEMYFGGRSLTARINPRTRGEFLGGRILRPSGASLLCAPRFELLPPLEDFD